MSQQKHAINKVATEEIDIWHQTNLQSKLKNQKEKQHHNIVKQQSKYTIYNLTFWNKKEKNNIGNFNTTLNKKIKTHLLLLKTL